MRKGRRVGRNLVLLVWCTAAVASALPKKANDGPGQSRSVHPGASIVAPCDWAHAGKKSNLYSVKVEGKPVFVGEFLSEHFTHFAFSGSVRLDVTCLHHNRSLVSRSAVSPERLGIRPRIEDDHVRFTISKPGAYVLRVGGPLEPGFSVHSDRLLLIFADPLEKSPPHPDGRTVLDVTEFGADGTGRTDCTAAIEKAVTAAPRGGTVFFPKGVYRVHGARIGRGNVRLYLASGALIRSPERYGGPGSLSPALRLDGVHHVVIEGRGMIEANGWTLRPTNCDDLTIRGLIIRSTAITNRGPRAGGRALVPWQCAHLHIDNVKAMTAVGTPVGGKIVKGKDGLNLDSCNHCLVERCFSISGDDTFCAKANAREETDVTYRNNVAVTPTNAVKIGTGNRFGVADVTWQDIDIVHGSIRFTDSRKVRMRNVHVRNVRIEDYNNVLLSVGRVWRVHEPRMLKSDLDVVIENLIVSRVHRGKPGVIVDLDPAQSHVFILFRNLQVAGKLIRGVRDLRDIGFQPVVSGLTADDRLLFLPARSE